MQNPLTLPIIRQTRRNHALEHATIHFLSARTQGVSMSGLSDATGYWLLGNVTTEQVEKAAADALAKLRGGERRLAIHPNCGTNLVTTGYLTSMVGMATTRGVRNGRDVRDRLPVVMMSMIAALVVSQPLGTWLQAHVTTDGDPADTEILSVRRVPAQILGVPVHRVNTRSS